MTRLTLDNIYAKLSELDEQTMLLDPENPADLDKLHRIADMIERLEDLVHMARGIQLLEDSQSI